MLIASLQVLHQFRFVWFVEVRGVPWTQVGWVLGSVCPANLVAHLLGFGSLGGRFGVAIGVARVSMIVLLLGAACLAMVGGCVRLLLGVWEVGRCLF